MLFFETNLLIAFLFYKMDQSRQCSPVNPNRVVATLTGIQVVIIIKYNMKVNFDLVIDASFMASMGCH